MTTELLLVDRLRHRYASGRCIDFGRFSVDAGQVLMLRGTSGSGKSTLLHLLAGVLPVGQDQGAIQLAGMALHTLSTAQRDCLRPYTVGWMPQRLCLIQSLSVRDNVLLPIALAAGSVSAPDPATRADALLAALDIAALASRRPRDISVGQAARVSLARALVAQPALLLADEPTAALDAESAARVAQAIAAYAAAGGTAIIASHDEALTQQINAQRPTNPVRQMTLTEDGRVAREHA